MPKYLAEFLDINTPPVIINDLESANQVMTDFYNAEGNNLELFGRNVGISRLTLEDDMEYRIRIVSAALGLPKDILKSPEEKPPFKLRTRFQLLKGQYA